MVQLLNAIQAEFRARQIGFDFEACDLAQQRENAQQFAKAFIRLANDPKGHWSNHYLCSCGQHWKLQNNVIGSDLCSHCHAEVEPYVSNDGSLDKRQMLNVFHNAQLRQAFTGIETGESVFSKLLKQLELVNFTIKYTDERSFA